jgi:hypothetical protein
MKKRDLLILVILIGFVIFFTAWEKITQRKKEDVRLAALQAERAELEKRLAGYDFILDSMSTSMLHFIDSLKAEAAFFESVARQMQLEVADDHTAPETLAARAEPVAPKDTVPELVLEEFDRAMADLPGDLTSYERKIAVKEIENTILAKVSLSREDFVAIRRDKASTSSSSGDGS